MVSIITLNPPEIHIFTTCLYRISTPAYDSCAVNLSQSVGLRLVRGQAIRDIPQKSKQKLNLHYLSRQRAVK